MFEHYVQRHTPARGHHLRLALALHLTALVTAGVQSFTWLMGKLQVARVEPLAPAVTVVQPATDIPWPEPPEHEEEFSRIACNFMPFDIDEPEEDPPVPLDDLSMNTAPAPLRVPGFAAIPGVDHRPPGFAPLRLATSQEFRISFE